MKSVKFSAMVIAISAVWAVAPHGTSAQLDQLDGEIIFSSGHYYFELFHLSGDTVHQLTNLSDEIGGLKSPRWSPDGERIAFTNGLDVYVIDADGSNLDQLTQEVTLHDHYVDWSPDGKTIAVSSAREDTWRIRLIDIYRHEIVNITKDDNLDGMFGLSWSPDGENIVFTSNRHLDGDGTGLYRVEVATSEISPLEYLADFTYRTDRYPRWSPDGNQIAFVSDIGGGGWNIYLTDADGSKVQGLTDENNAPHASGAVGRTMSWSPDGSRIVFTACPTVYPESCDLYMINVDGTGFTQLTDTDESGEFDPDWKPYTRSDTNAG